MLDWQTHYYELWRPHLLHGAREEPLDSDDINSNISKGKSYMVEADSNRVMARIEGDFVVFLIGMRINKPWKINKWWPLVTSMQSMLKELENSPPEMGYLGHTVLGFGTIIQYWRSFDQLEHYARSPDHLHWPAWLEFNKRTKGSRGDVGVWHETYLVRSGEFETIYTGMPLFGLAKAADVSPISANSDRARQRMKLRFETRI